MFGQEQLRRQEETDSDQENEESRSDEESEEHRKMPPKTDERQLPDEATPEQIAAYRKTLQKERTVAKREYTRRKNILDKMLGDASGRPEFKELAELAMQELTLQYNLVSNRNHDLEMNSTEDELDAFMDTVNDGYKETQLAFIRWKLAAEAGQPDDPPARRPNEAVYSVIGLNFDIRKTIREKFSGDDIRSYASFKINWMSVAGRLEEMGFSDAQKLMELKKVLDKNALELIKRLPDEDHQYERAMTLLDKNFQNNIKIAEMVIIDLLNTPKMGNTAESIGITYNAMIQAEQTLDGLKVTDMQRGQLLFNVICESKLNNNLLRLWTQEKNKKRDDASPLGHSATKDDLLNLILENKQIVKRLEENKEKPDEKKQEKQEKSQGGNKQSQQGSGHGKGTVSGSFGVRKEDSKTSKTCLICKKEGHAGPDCFKVKNLKTPQERRKFLTEQKINVCRNCLKGPHMTKDCRQKPCQTCGMQHHLLLHEQRDSRVHSASDQKKNEEDVKTSGAISCSNNKKPILQSCQAWAISPSGEKFLARVFLDSGSEITMIRRKFSEEMGLQGPATSLNISVAGGSALPPTMEKRVKLKLQSIDGSYMSPKLEGITAEKITRDLRPVEINTNDFEHLKGIDFTETYPRAEKEVDILIGVDHYTSLMKGEIIRGQPQEPTAIATKLGFVLSGSA